MSFLIQRTSGRNLTLTQIHGEVLRIGRGTNQELRSENPAVALEHALIESDVAGYLITDKGSITGTYVNKKPVETSRLGKGDAILQFRNGPAGTHDPVAQIDTTSAATGEDAALFSANSKGAIEVCRSLHPSDDAALRIP